jgi:hypothetical protein
MICHSRSEITPLFEKEEKTMLIVVAMKAVREIIAETFQLRREMAKRYPGILAE